jgi:hypothetical protein
MITMMQTLVLTLTAFDSLALAQDRQTPSATTVQVSAPAAVSTIDTTRTVILPAWSSDGAKIAFLQKSGKNKYGLFMVDVRP